MITGKKINFGSSKLYMKAFVVLFFLIVSSAVYAQFPTLGRQDTGNRGSAQGTISNNKVADFVRPPVEDYKIISIKNDTIVVDLSLIHI